MTTLKMSTSSDVVNAFSAADGPVSQSRSVVASYGTADNGTEVWFNMVAFAEDAQRPCASTPFWPMKTPARASFRPNAACVSTRKSLFLPQF